MVDYLPSFILIKRYPNRKFYDTQRKRYINLDDIGILLRQRSKFQILEHPTGEDITVLILAKVLSRPVDFKLLVNEEIGSRIHRLVEQGYFSEPEGNHLMELLLAVGDQFDNDSLFNEHSYEVLFPPNWFASRDEFLLLVNQVDALAEKVNHLAL